MAVIDLATALEDEASKQDPRKRQQIMQGARQVFLEKGFDAASMNDIAKAAGVSKGTLYVYFENKERLFVDLISTEKREELFRVLKLDPHDPDVASALTKFGIEFCEILTRPYYIRSMCTVFSILNRMPEIGREFYGRGPKICSDHLSGYFAAQVEAGVLDIEDCAMAAVQFIELSQAGLMRKLLFGIIETPTHEDIRYRVEMAVKFFMKVYGRPVETQPA